MKFGHVGKSPITIHTFDVSCHERLVLPRDGKIPFAYVEKVQCNVPPGFVEVFNEGVHKYLEGEWSESADFFQKAQRFVEGDAPSAKMVGILKGAQGKTPPDWAGFRHLF